MLTRLFHNYPWLPRLLGIPAAQAYRIDHAQIAWAAPWPRAALILILAGAALWFGWCYWRDGTRTSWWIKGPLVALRLIALAALLVMLAQPTLRFGEASTVRPSVALLVDNSDSMARADPRLPAARASVEAAATGIPPSAVGRQTRLARVDAMLNRAGLLSRLSGRFNVRLYTFAGAVRSLALPADAKGRRAYRFDVQRDRMAGDSTQMSPALRKPLEDLAGQPLAGALLISDGGNNLGEDPITAADSVRQGGLAISTLGVGDPTQTKDVALISVLADDVVRLNNTVTVYASLTQRGYAGKPIPVVLRRGGVQVARQTVVLGPDDQKQEIRFSYVASQAGRFGYTVTAGPLRGESTTANNRRAFVQTVITKPLKVLYVENEPRYEFRYLRSAILRDTSVKFACLLLSGDDLNEGGEGNIPVRGFPTDEKTLFDYDIVILGDVPRSYFTDAQLTMLRRFVEDRGASLLVIAGESHMPQEYAGTPLDAVLPVQITAAPDPVQTDDPFRWQLTDEGKSSPVMMLDDDPAASAHVWDNLPGMYWTAGVPAAKPGATVLAVHPDRRSAQGPYPLVATQIVGAGRSYIELVDGTWRWRWRVGDRYFYRYWGQVIRWLTPRELPGNSRLVQINADRDSYRLGERVLLNARLLDAYYHPLKVKSVEATVGAESAASERQVTLDAAPGSPGLYTCEFQPDRVGKYEVTLTSPASSAAKGSAGFVVESLALEQQRPELNEPLMRRIASAGGGRYYRPDQLASWISSLPYHPLVVRTDEEYEVWNAPLLLILALGPLCVEWLVRKRRGLL